MATSTAATARDEQWQATAELQAQTKSAISPIFQKIERAIRSVSENKATIGLLDLNEQVHELIVGLRAEEAQLLDRVDDIFYEYRYRQRLQVLLASEHHGGGPSPPPPSAHLDDFSDAFPPDFAADDGIEILDDDDHDDDSSSAASWTSVAATQGSPSPPPGDHLDDFSGAFPPDFADDGIEILDDDDYDDSSSSASWTSFAMTQGDRDWHDWAGNSDSASSTSEQSVGLDAALEVVLDDYDDDDLDDMILWFGSPSPSPPPPVTYSYSEDSNATQAGSNLDDRDLGAPGLSSAYAPPSVDQHARASQDTSATLPNLRPLISWMEYPMEYPSSSSSSSSSPIGPPRDRPLGDREQQGSPITYTNLQNSLDWRERAVLEFRQSYTDIENNPFFPREAS